MSETPRTFEDMTEQRKYAIQVPTPESSWPTMARVEAEYPQLCGEEQVWILESLIHEAHRLKYGGQNADNS